jgi:NAD(P)-dependent dehydrogenase (short-subunit alcohol dehydrogenase family)
MTRGIFLAGNESSLSRAIEAELEKRVERYAAALVPNRFSGVSASPPAASEKRIPLDWNPSSPISARALILAAENRLDRIDEAILICSPPSIRSSAAEIPLADVEIMVNDHIKGWFFLVKELAALFRNRKSGILAFVYSDLSLLSGGRDDTADLLGPSSHASFRALTQGLLAAAHNEPYLTMGFSNSEAGNDEAFTAFICKNLDEANKRQNGKLHKFGRFNLFK